MNRLQQGAKGEAIAREFLESWGYQFIEANFHRRVGEIDLVMLTPDDGLPPRTIVFVEVRYRATKGFGGAIASIEWKKQRKMLRVAKAWLQKNAKSTDLARIDVIAIEPDNQQTIGKTTSWKGYQLLWIRNALEDST